MKIRSAGNTKDVPSGKEPALKLDQRMRTHHLNYIFILTLYVFDLFCIRKAP